VQEEHIDILKKMAAFVPYDKHRTCAPIAILEAYWRIMAGQANLTADTLS